MPRCDVVHVDGCKDMACRAHDLELMHKASHNRTLFLTDDASLVCEPQNLACCRSGDTGRARETSKCAAARQQCDTGQLWTVADGRAHHDYRRNAQIFSRFASKKGLTHTTCVPTARCLDTQFDAVCAATSRGGARLEG